MGTAELALFRRVKAFYRSSPGDEALLSRDRLGIIEDKFKPESSELAHVT